MKNKAKAWTIAGIIAIVVLTFLVYAADPNSPSLRWSDAIPNFVNISEEVKVNVSYVNNIGYTTWMYICKETQCNDCNWNYQPKSGCYCFNETGSTNGYISCKFTVDENDYPNGYYIKLVNASDPNYPESDVYYGDDADSFDVNHRPTATGVSISATNKSLSGEPRNLSKLFCNYTFSDPDSDTERPDTATYVWYKKRIGDLSFSKINGAVQHFLRKNYTKKGDRLICLVNVTDEHYLDSYPGRNSTVIEIVNSVPNIPKNVRIPQTSPSTSTDLTCLWDLGADYDLDPLKNETRWYNNSREVPELRNTTLVLAGNITSGSNWTCSVRHNDGEDYSAWVNSSVKRVNFVPIVSSATIYPSYSYSNNTLFGRCMATDVENIRVDFYYKWYKNGTLNRSGKSSYRRVGEIIDVTELSPGNTTHFESWTFSCMAVDNLENSSWINSSPIFIRNAAPTFTLGPRIIGRKSNETLRWSYTAVDIDNDDIEIEFIKWYKDNVHQISLDNKNVSPDNTNVGEEWKVEIELKDEYNAYSRVKSSSPIIIGSSKPNITSVVISTMKENSTVVNNNLKFTVNWTDPDYGYVNASVIICNSSGATALGCLSGSRTFCKTGYYPDSPLRCKYLVQEIDSIDQRYYAIVCNNYSMCSDEFTGIFHKFNDSTKPNITEMFENWTMYSDRDLKIRFNVSDNHNISLETLIINISNQTNMTYFVHPTSIYNSKGLPRIHNISCTGNRTFQECSFIFHFSQGFHNISFKVNDSRNNFYSDTFSVLIESELDDISNLKDGYVDHAGQVKIADIAVNNHLFVNWSNITSTQAGIRKYEYALGTSENYLGNGWNSKRDWTSVGVNTHANLTLKLTPGISYFFHVRGISNSGAISDVATSDGLIYEDNTPPRCNIVIDYGPYHNDWTNSKAELSARWNFSESETRIVQYEFAIGNTTPPAQGYPPLNGFDNTYTRHTTQQDNVSITTLNLEENVTYYFSLRARNQNIDNNSWSSWCYSDGVTVDTNPPFGGYISYPDDFVAYTNITINLDIGEDNQSGIDDERNVSLMIAKTPINLDTYTCPAFSDFSRENIYPNYPPYPHTLQYNTTPGYCYKFRLVVRDRAGNEVTYYSNDEAQSDKTVITDTTPPSSFQVFDAGHKTYDGTELDFSWTQSTDEQSGIEYYSISIWKKSQLNGNLLLAYDWFNVSSSNLEHVKHGLQLEDERQYYIKVRAVNRAGLYTEAISNGIIYIDISPPSALNLTSIENNTFFGGYYIDQLNNGNTTINFTSDDYDLSRCIFSQTDSGYYETSSNMCTINGTGSDKSVSCKIPASGQGKKTYYIYCRDTNGNNQYREQGPNIPYEAVWVNDWGGPLITINNPINGSVVGGVIDIDANIIDRGIGVISYASLRITNLTGDTILSANLNSPGYNYSWNATKNSSNGIYYITITANDTIGNENSVSINVTVDNNVPMISLTYPEYTRREFNLTVITQLFVNMSVNITNSSGHIMKYISINGTTLRNYDRLVELINITPGSIWKQGKYSVKAMAVNNASVKTYHSGYFIYDISSPKITGITDLSTTVINTKDSLNISVNITENYLLSKLVIRINDSINWTNYSWINGSDQNEIEFEDGAFNLVYTVPIEKNNESISYYAIVYDTAGNNNQSRIINFSVTNTPPSFLQDNLIIEFQEDQNIFSYSIADEINDHDNDTLTITGINGSTINLTQINQTSKTLYFSVGKNYFGNDQIVINITDPYGGFANKTYNITVLNVNDPPLFNSSASVTYIKMEEDSYNDSLNILNMFYDVDNASLNYGYESNNLNTNVSITINSITGVVNISSSNDYFGVEKINITASDGQYTNRSGVITINITSVNDAPELSSVTNFIALVGQELEVNLQVNDLDSSGVNISLNDTRFALESNSSSEGVFLYIFSWTPSPGEEGIHTINATAIDNEGGFDSKLFNVTVVGGNDMDNDGLPDSVDPDIDGDGILNTRDFLLGNSSYIQTNIPNLMIYVNNSNDLSKIFNDTYLINLTNGSHRFASFLFDFEDGSVLNTSNISLYIESRGSFTGISIKTKHTGDKEVMLHPNNFSTYYVCIKDNGSRYVNTSHISNDCNHDDEQLILCGGEVINGYECDIINNKFRITGLEHSAVLQMDGCTDRDGDGYGVGSLCSGPDRFDNDPNNYPGALCSRACYSGARYNINGVCVGGTNVCGSSSSSSGSISPAGTGFKLTKNNEDVNGSEEDEKCRERWVCTPWTQCSSNGFQTRECNEINNCGTTDLKESTRRFCSVIEDDEDRQITPDPSCDDGIKNQGETGMDCGGPCPACPTCVDGFQNQGEAGVDCGGPCPACGPTTEQPRIIEDSKYKIFILPGLALIISLILISIGFYRKSLVLKQKQKEEFWIKEEAGHLLFYKKFGYNIFDKLMQLRMIIRKKMAAGEEEQKIKEDLIEEGWDKAMVKKSFLLNKYVSLEMYIRRRLDKGKRYDQIKTELEKIGWKDESINEVFELNRLIDVSLSVRKKLGKGASENDIRRKLSEEGWPDDLIEELFELNQLLELEIYINNMLSEGISEEVIKYKLIDEMWPEHIIDEAIMFCKLTR